MKRNALIISLVLITLSAFAQRLTEQQAKERVADFLKLKSPKGVALAKVGGVRVAGLKTVPLGIDGIYVFNVDGGGYVVAGGDARIAPVLGYGDNGTLNVDDIPANMKAWLESYARQAAFAAENNLDYSASSANTDRQPIEPMLKSNWGQNKPFNRLCPLVDQDDPTKGNCPTGCVATAMAQVVNYYKWPVKAEGTGTASDQYFNDYKIDMSNDYFDWNNILDVYTNEKREVIAGNETQWDAVSLLMRDMGYSVNMRYEANNSGALSMSIPYAMVNNFGYDKGAHIESRDWYTDEQWENLVYENLSNYGPLIYAGITKDSEGHEFVCDGYRGDGYYHFNWGWDGMSDGYFLLSSLSPTIQSIGGSANNYSFDYEQEAIIGLCKPREDCKSVVNIYQKQDLIISGGLMKGDFLFLVSKEESIDLGLWTKNLLTGEETFRKANTQEVKSPEESFFVDIDCDVPDGEYKVMPAFRISGEEQWQFFKANRNVRNYLLLDVKDGKKTYKTDEQLVYKNINFPTLHVMPNAEYSQMARIETNGANHDAMFSYKLYDELTGEMVMESQPEEWKFSLDQDRFGLVIDISVGDVDKSHTFKLVLFDGDKVIAEETGITAIDKPVFEEIEPLTIAEAVDGKIYRGLETFHMSFKYKLIGNFPSTLWLSVTDGQSILTENVLDSYLHTDYVNNVLSLSQEFFTDQMLMLQTSNLKNLELRLVMRYDEKHAVGLKDGSEIVLKLEVVDYDPTGVETINAEGVLADERRYDLQGRPVTKPSQHSIYVVKGKKVIGGK